MAKIAFIASDKNLYTQGKISIQELGLQNKVVIYFARLQRAARLAKVLQNEDISVIIARGGTAKLINESNINIPIVEIIVTGQDLAAMFQESQHATGIQNPKVAFIAFENIAPDMEALSHVLGIDLTVHRIQEPADIPLMIQTVAQAPYDVLVGGIKTVVMAQKLGLKTILIHSGSYSIKAALLEAQKIALGRKIEKENAGKFKALIDYSIEGIISVDHEERVQVFNPAAEQLLRISSKDILGQKINILTGFPNMDQCITKGQQTIGQVLRWDTIWLTINMIPIIIDKTIIGAFITFQNISHIQEVEAKIRNEVLVRKFTAKYHFSDILGRSPQILETIRIAREIANVDATALLIGESGTGKELFAQSIHNSGSRKLGPFVAINCAALPPNLLESELFGYVEGAFTGATKKGKAGLFEMAHRGTIFLDEISEMDQYGQARLLRVIQERQVMRLGDDKYIPIDVRIIAATNKNLSTLAKEGHFRQDLFYRLNVLLLNVPPLRKRNGDIEYLSHHFLEYYKSQYQKQLELTPEGFHYFNQHAWPGNVRELAHFMERLVLVVGEKRITDEIIKRYFENREYDTDIQTESNNSPNSPVPEDTKILLALETTKSNIKQAAKLLGMARSTLYQKLKIYNIEVKKNYR